MTLIPLREDLIPFLEPYLPRLSELHDTSDKPQVTLTYAQSLDSRIAKVKGTRTIISHEETKTMTHYLRYHHDGIMLGCGTVLVDNPGLNCKWIPKGKNLTGLKEISPRPIILDPNNKWKFKGSKMEELFKEGNGKSPIVVVKTFPEEPEEFVDYLVLKPNFTGKMNWEEIFLALKSKFGIKSIMVEGGGIVINDLLQRAHLVDALIVTVGATYLGNEGVEVSPSVDVKLTDVCWWKGTRDSVICARLTNK